MTLSRFLSSLVVGILAFQSPVWADENQRTVDALQQAVKTDPSNSELWVHLGFAYRKAGDLSKAQESFEKASSLNPRDPDAYFMLGLIYESKGQNQDALRAWKACLANQTDPTRRAQAENHIHHLSQ